MGVSKALGLLKFMGASALLFVCEVLASFLVWSGIPTDWLGEPPYFWHFERARLEYWALFFVPACLVFVIGSYTLRSRTRTNVLWLLAAVLAAGVETSTSVVFWRQLPRVQASYLGWPSFGTYFRDHLVSWTAFLLIGFLLSHLWLRKGKKHLVAPSANPSAQYVGSKGATHAETGD
jgi:hypothetical protein